MLPPSSALEMEAVCSPKRKHISRTRHSAITKKTTIYNTLQYQDSNHTHRCYVPVPITTIKTVPNILSDVSGFICLYTMHDPLGTLYINLKNMQLYFHFLATMGKIYKI
jgi:hypothetical protein